MKIVLKMVLHGVIHIVEKCFVLKESLYIMCLDYLGGIMLICWKYVLGRRLGL